MDKVIQQLIKRADEQHLVLYDVPFPGLFLFVSKNLGDNPWKIFIPAALILTAFLRIVGGVEFDNKILWIFGSL